ncbi:MAG: carboxypeptidase-like regulatory domain-containing protein [Verrucomicrobia bacterium]|nr:carboxypeptidase-like regulatory domain-containing protein [Cytophagales bacterium]
MLGTKLIFASLYLFTAITVFAQSGLKGNVKNTKGEKLSFATISIKGTSKGTIANEDGNYEIALTTGTYDIIFQYLGHKSLIKNISVGSQYEVFDVVLEEQVINLNEVKISNLQENPAYTIMRKAISMARYHVLEVDAYTARTYVKGSGKVRDFTGLAKALAGDKIKKETGLEIGQTYVLEAINDIGFRQPNTIKETVISNRDNFPPQLKNNSSPIQVANVNFYKPDPLGGGSVSPLSPAAFSYYTFSYEGSFEDRGLEVNKIRLIPKFKSENLYTGTINIIENTWAIHSLDLKSEDQNGKYSLKQLLSPFKDVWMPVYFEFNVAFSAFGINADFRYITNVRDYNLTVNPTFHQQPTVIDEKIDKAAAATLKDKKIDRSQALAQQEMTRKQARKLLQDLEKEEKKERKARNEETDVVRDYTFKIDTLAAKRSSDFWNTERQVPLTAIEIKGYRQADSLTVVNADKIRKDSIKNLPTFKAKHIFFGHTYNYGKRDPENFTYPESFIYKSPLATGNLNGDFYNTVEGYYLNAGFEYKRAKKLDTRLSTGVDFRYSITRNTLNGVFNIDYSFNKIHNAIGFSGGRFVRQFNNENPISPSTNMVYSLFFEDNYMKLYEKAFVSGNFRKWFSEQISLVTNLEFARRYAMPNNHFTPWRNSAEKEYSSNNPITTELANTFFETHNTLILDVEFRIRPFAKVGRYNGREYSINNRKPNFTFKSRNGLLTESRFWQAEAGYTQNWELNKAGNLQINAKIGKFFQKPAYFMDFKHFNGNQTIFSNGGVNAFRNLDYYLYSTADSYLEIHANDEFDKLLLTQITWLRLGDFRENLFVNYFNAFEQGNRYAEAGYGLQGGTILLGFGVEVGASFLNESYNGTFVRLRLPF